MSWKINKYCCLDGIVWGEIASSSETKKTAWESFKTVKKGKALMPTLSTI